MRARKSDFIVQVFRCGGKGGQKQNKVATGVRIIHKPTGMRVESRQHRTQHRNKVEAFRRLARQLVAMELVGIDRSQRVTTVVRTYNFAENRITDHDTGDKYPADYFHKASKMDAIIEERRRKMNGS